MGDVRQSSRPRGAPQTNCAHTTFYDETEYRARTSFVEFLRGEAGELAALALHTPRAIASADRNRPRD